MYLALCILATAALFAADPPGVTVTEGTPEIPGTLRWDMQSPYLAGTNAVEVLLPDHRAEGQRFPVIYVLPVNAGTRGQWGHPLEVAKAYDLANRHGVILVVPAYPDLPWFGDNPDKPTMRQSSHLTEAVMPLVESRLPAIAEPKGRFLIGFSKSGLGALGIFLRQPERLNAIAVFETWYGQPNSLQWEKWGFADCYGTRANFDAWDPLALIEQRKELLKKDQARITVLNGGPGIRLGVEMLLGQLRDRQVPHTLIANPAWGHTWTSGWLPLAVAALVDGQPKP